MIPKPYIRAALFLLTALILPIVQMTAAQPTCDPNAPILRVSIANGGGQASLGANSLSWPSGNGRYILFTSSSPDLVTGDTNGFIDVFRYDRLTCSVIRVSVASDGTQANSYSSNGAFVGSVISADGRFVAFDSSATNLVSNDTNNVPDVFLHDVETGETRRISVSATGQEGNAKSTGPSISDDGRYVVFSSLATNLVSGSPDNRGTFVYNRLTGTLERIVIGQHGRLTWTGWYQPISGDGRFIAFTSDLDDLVPNDTNHQNDVFVYDRQTHTVTRVSVASDRTQANGYSGPWDVSADGRFVLFYSEASNLVAGDTNQCPLFNFPSCRDVFVHDRSTGETIRVSVGTGNIEGNGQAGLGNISDDGRIVVFSSDAPNLVPNDTNNVEDVFVRDLYFQETYRVSGSSIGGEANNESLYGLVSPDGHYVTFYSSASNLVPDDTNQHGDIFMAVIDVPGIFEKVPQRNYYTSLNVNLSWNRVPLAAGYELEVDDDAGFGSPQNIQFNGEVLAYTVTLPQNGVYYWRVRASDALGFPGNWSVIEKFTVNAP